MITIHVKRFDSEKDSEPHIETYEIEKSSGMKVLNESLGCIGRNQQ